MSSVGKHASAAIGVSAAERDTVVAIVAALAAVRLLVAGYIDRPPMMALLGLRVDSLSGGQ